MNLSPTSKLARTGLAAAALGACAALPAHAIPMVALTTTNALMTLDSASPANGSLLIPISGLAVGERMLSIDLRPTTNVLYGVSSASNVYTISMLGAATLVGALDAALTGSAVGMDFNPVGDLAGGASLRVVSSSGQNYAYNVNGAGSNVGGEVAVMAGISSVAYANNDLNPLTSTALYYIDSATDVLRTAPGSFNNPTIVPVGPLGVDATGIGGFEIFGINAGYAAFTDADTGQSKLYTVSLGTGAASPVGSFGILGNTTIAPPILGLTLAAVPEPGTYAMLLAGLAAIGGLVRRRRS